ncbi:MAG: Ig-like domain-containing protein [bacterium]
MRKRIAVLALAALVFSACGGGAGGSGGGGAAPGGGGDAPSGAVATGLQTATDGWSFPNFPSASFPDVNFDETDLVSMFGSDETICVGGVATPCKLTAEAAAWARMVNQARASGHCEGLVALASSRFNNKETPATVKLPSQDETLHAIMRTFATQFLPEVQDSIGKWMEASFEEKIDEMKKSFAAGALKYTLGVYTAGGGHALLPYAVEYPTPDTPRVMLYDSNWPGKNRYVDIDLKAKTWRFSFSGADPANDPDAWTGGPQDMDLTPFDAREGTCPFCGKDVKVAKTTMLIRSANLDWSVETDGGTVSPANPTGTDGTTVKAVKGFSFSSAAGKGALKKESYDYVVSVPDYPAEAATTTSGVKKKKRKSKLKFSGATSVYALMPEGIAQFTTPGSEDNPVEIEGSSIATTDPGVDLTLASGNLVANASGSAVSLSVEGDTMAVAVTAANGQVIKQEVSVDQPTVQMKADPEGGGITVLAASAAGVVEKTQVSSTGETTKSVVTEALNLSEVKAELPAALASKEIAALPSLATRDMANPDYKVDAAYSAPTTIPSKSGDQVAEAAPTTQAKASSAAAPNEPGPTTPVKNAALPTTLPPKGAAPADPDATPTTVKRTVAAATSGTGTATAVALKPSLGRFSIPGVTFGDAAFTIDEPSSNSSGGWKFTSSKPDVVEVSSLTGRATIKGAGSTTITATQSAVKGFEQASITALLIVGRDTPVLGAYTTASRTFGDESFTLKNPTSNSTGVFTVDSSDESVAKFSKTSGKLVIAGAGKTTITATQAATDDYLGASKSFVLTVKKGTPELGAFDDVARTFGEAGFTLAKPSSDSRAAITLSSSNPAVATVDGASGAVSIVGAGTTTFTASQVANDDFVAASKAMTFTVRQAIPTLGSFVGVSKTFGDTDFTLAKPSSPSGGAFSFSSSNAGVVSVDGDGKVSVVGAGTSTITATQAASGNYTSSSAAAVVTVGRATTTIANLSLSNMTYGASDVTLAPRSNNPSPFTFTSSSPSVLAVNASTGRVSVVGAGTATITVRQASSANYEAGSESLTVVIGRATPTLSSFSAISKDYGDAPFTLTPPESNSPAPFTYESSAPTVASINSTTGVVTILNVTTVGSPVTLTVRQAQTDNYAAITATTTLIIGRGTPVFGDFAITTKVWGSSNFSATAPTSTSAGAFTYNIVDVDGVNEAAIATITSAGIITVTGPGSVQVRATQAANTLYVSSSITATFTVTSATPSFGTFVAPAKTFGDAQFTMAPPSSPSSGAFSFTSSDTSVATINASGQVTIVGAGSTTITASQVAASPYTARSTTSVLTVAKATAVLSGFGGQTSGLAGVRYVNYYNDNVNWFATATRHGQTVTSTSIQSFTSSADNYSWQWLGTFRAGVGGSYSFCTASDDASHLWIGATATTGFTTANAVVNNGGAHGVVTRCGNITLSAGAEYPIRIQFGEAGGGDVMNVYFTPPGGSATYNGTGYYFTGGGLTKTLGDLPFTPTLPSSVSTGAITYGSSNPSVATINPTTGLITLQSGGTTTITAEQAATGNYNSSTTTTTLTVLRDPLLNGFTIPAKTYGAAPFILTAPASSSDGAFSYTSSNTSVATVNSTTGAVTIVGIGSTTITTSQLATSVYAAGTITATLTVEATTATSISAGQGSTCMRTTSGAAQCFGLNNYGQLGDGTNTDRTTAVGVVGLSSGVASLSSGGWHSCAVTDSGSVKCWGRNDWGNLGNGNTNTSYTPVDVSGLNATAVKVVTTQYSSCVLTSVGGVKCWGYGGWGLVGDGTGSSRYTPVDVSGMTSGVIAIAAGGQHVCAIRNTGALLCWGWNGHGQLGDGTSSDRYEPSDVNGLDSGVIGVAPGSLHTCASLATGAVKCWGLNNNGRLGNNDWNQSSVPVSVYGMTDATASISSGEAHTCVVKNSGALWCWGYNGRGEFGNGTTSDSNIPVSITGLGSTVRSVSAGLAGAHTCALTSDGTAKCWGYNGNGQLGDASTTQRLSPNNVGGIVAPQINITTLSGFALPGSGYTASSPGFTLAPPTSSRAGAFTFASTNPNSATIDATTGEVTILGGGSTLLTATQAATSTHDAATAYVSLAFAPVIAQLSLAYHNSCGLTTAGGVKCWGYNGWGQIGSAASGVQTTPVNVPGYTSGIAAIATAHHATCALTTAGAVRCWGWGGYGGLGSGISSGVTAITSGYAHTCALMAYGGVKCWGYNGYGQLGDGTNNDHEAATDVVGLSSGVVAIDAGFQHTCALLNTGAMKCWGSDDQQQLGDGATGRKNVPTQVTGLTSGVASISSGTYHTCAVLATGAAQCWGANNHGQLGDASSTYRSVPTDVSTLSANVASISAGWEHTCARLTTGAAKCWGRNSEGQLGDGTNGSRNVPVNVVGLSSGVASIETSQSLSTCATVADNNVKCWGYNEWGQLGDGTQTHRNTPVDITQLLSGASTATTLGALTLPGSRYTVGSADFTLDPPSSSRAGTITFSSSNTEVATVNATTGLVHIEGLGNTVLAANIGGTGQYKGATSTVTLTVNTACAAGGLCSIGDTGPGGGVVFYDAGSNQSWGRYLEAAPSDLSTAMAWCNDVSSAIGANGYVVGTGNANTVAMDTACTSGAGQSAADYANNGYGDWYLPSLNELTEMFDRRAAIGGFVSASYWSSSEENGEFAKRLGFPDGGMSGHVKSQGFRVRPVRAFTPLTDCQLGMSCVVGDIGPAGGRIIYVNPDASNEYDYVEAAPSDIAPTVWCVGAGATTALVGAVGWMLDPSIAKQWALVQLRNCTAGAGVEANAYTANGITGWSIPNVGLVELMKTHLFDNNIGNLTPNDYISSNDHYSELYVAVNMSSGARSYPYKTAANRVRPVRFFAKTDRRKFTPTLSGISVPSNSMAYGAADFNVSTSSSGMNEMGGSFTNYGVITYTSSDTAVATIEANTGRVSIVGSGSFTITATQTAWGVFKAPVAVTNSISVSNGTPQFSGLALPGTGYRADDAPFTVTAAASSNSPGLVTYSSSNTAIATVNATSGLVTIVGAGTATITATLAASGFWNGATLSVPLSIGALCADGGECRIGDVGPAGGKIFLIPSSTGNTTGKFFEAAAADLSSSMAWCDDDTTSIAGANGYAIGTGEANTIAMDAACTSGAGQSAADFTNNGYGDWYLPSLDELTAMLGARTTIGGFASASYWSSSEENGGFAKRLGFPDGGMSGHVKAQDFQVRPIRSFEIKRSCLDIKNSTATNANGMYTIALSVGGAVVNTPVYCLMDSAIDGGGWTMAMKAPRDSQTFYYSSDYWTTSNNLNVGNVGSVTADATNAKFDTFNYMSATSMLAVFPDAGINGGSITGHTYGWTWKQVIPNGPKTPLQIFSDPTEQFIGDAYLYSGFDTRVWTRQRDIRFYGFNWNDNHKARWGFGWNENGGGLFPNGVRGSDDASGGIGLQWNNYSAGDGSFCCTESNGLNRSMSFEMYVR